MSHCEYKFHIVNENEYPFIRLESCELSAKRNSKFCKTHMFIIGARELYKSQYSYSRVKFVNKSTKVEIICKDYCIFSTILYNFLNIHGCLKCGIITRAKKNTKTTESFIERAIKTHGDRYDYSETEYVNADTKLAVICKTHGKFFVTPMNHLSGSNCQRCVKNYKCTQEDFIEKARVVHGDKYDYSRAIYVDSKSKIDIVCKIHGIFLQSPDKHLQARGCPKCGRIAITNSKRKNVDVFIEQAKEKHGDKYDYSKVVYTNTHARVIIRCTIHDLDFRCIAKRHIYDGMGCPKCLSCPSCGLWRTCGKLCYYCDPSYKSSRYTKTKEMKIVAFLREQLPDHEFIHNKTVGKDCFR